VRKGVGLSQLCASAPHLAQAILCDPEKELNVLPVRHKRQPPAVTRVFGRNKLHADWIFSARKATRCPTHLDFIPAQLQYPTRCRTSVPPSCHASHRSQALLPSCAAPSFKRGLKRGVVRTRGRFKVLWRLFDLSSLSECVRHEKGVRQGPIRVPNSTFHVQINLYTLHMPI